MDRTGEESVSLGKVVQSTEFSSQFRIVVVREALRAETPPCDVGQFEQVDFGPGVVAHSPGGVAARHPRPNHSDI